MNRGDCKTIAKTLRAAHSKAFYAQTAATAWAFCVEAVADGLAQCGSEHFNREEFLATCRGGGAPSVGNEQEAS